MNVESDISKLKEKLKGFSTFKGISVEDHPVKSLIINISKMSGEVGKIRETINGLNLKTRVVIRHEKLNG